MTLSFKQKLFATMATLSLSTAAMGSVAVFAETFTASSKTPVTLKQAQEKALADAKTGQVTGYSQDTKNGKTTFEVTILDGQNEVEYDIDAQTGDILKTKKEDLSKDKEDKQLIGAKPQIDLAKAESLIKEKYPKLSLEELNLGVEEDTLVYEISGKDGDKEIEATLNATTGVFDKKDDQKDHENDHNDGESDHDDKESEKD
ncbi:PepSY domain-containing protein [Streptococcus hyovaginalis]|uniref:PepSY domain-containing protein n=1 Tax=Streptococcus hyovaginalis TaxID=149015 RepID=UPI002A788689|nr:PepSY domain-containing protein [Streptococcus hyovaginalis]MDY3023954.1 PepSY domain-containing protein [Streptococcus hyovaginalis]MDY4511035.1 PepSY domain-containing protein [Streptococcus hyovaginalis]